MDTTIQLILGVLAYVFADVLVKKFSKNPTIFKALMLSLIFIVAGATISVLAN